MEPKKRILFVCVGNSCRSQMAEGFASHYGKDLVECSSAGTSALGVVVDSTIEAMRERGIDISMQTSDQLTPEMIEWADTVVTMGCAPADVLCPPTYRGRKLDWEIEDPFGRSPEAIRRVRDEIERRVIALLEEETPEAARKELFKKHDRTKKSF